MNTGAFKMNIQPAGPADNAHLPEPIRKLKDDFEARLGPNGSLVASPKEAMNYIGIARAKLYELINGGELVSYHEGKSHKILWESINAYVSCHHPAEAHQVPFLICDTCSGAEEVCDPRVAELIEAQARALGFRAQAQTLEVHGVCKRCRKP